MLKLIARLLQGNAFTLTIALIGLLATIFNLWLAAQLRPLAENIGRIDIRVSALEKESATSPQLTASFIVVEEKVNALDLRLVRIENKIDRLLERQ
mgnify:CR=1 FL=1